MKTTVCFQWTGRGKHEGEGGDMTTKLLYKPFGLIFGMVAGAIAGALFKRTWRALADEEEAPQATDRDSGLLEITAGAAIHAAVFAGTRALVDRFGAAAFEHVTGMWPGKTESKA
jgi:hypothetical protein